MKRTTIAMVFCLAVMAAVLAACGAATPTPAQYSDAFAYCAAVGTIDTPDARYTGQKVPDAVANGLRKALQIPADTPDPTFSQRTFWRCMGGKVYACNVGANIPCTTKADTSRTPTQAVTDFCKANASADVVPAAVTGRATVYQWRCTNGEPAVVKQLITPDAQGFLASFWHEINPQ